MDTVTTTAYGQTVRTAVRLELDPGVYLPWRLSSRSPPGWLHVRGRWRQSAGQV